MNTSTIPSIRQFSYLAIVLALVVTPALAQSDINQPPINYSTAPVSDAIARLQQQIDSGEVKLEWDKQHGWLPSVLDLLKIPRSSQLLVFSKTSLQLAKISPRKPRVLYFNDEVYVGSVQLGDVLELSAVDSQQGAIFYAIDQKPSDKPKFLRSDNDCLTCHQNRRTQDVPGYLVRSVYPGKSGHPHFELGTTTTDQTTDFHDRFGGWYVTGKHGELRHRGNTIASKNAQPPIDPEQGANVTDLASRLNTDHYLTKHSDMIALMVLEHQAQMHNFITNANYEARQTKHYDATWNKVLKRPEDHRSEVSQRRLASAGEKLLRYLLFSGEFKLTSPIEGTSEFATEFASLGPHDSQGRSLRQFDLETRLFKYPCSFLIYSDAFAALPTSIREYIDGRLGEILNGEDQSPEFAHLSPEDRTAIREILDETLSARP